MTREFKSIGDCCGLHECGRACDVHVVFLVKNDDDFFAWFSDDSDTRRRYGLDEEGAKKG